MKLYARLKTKTNTQTDLGQKSFGIIWIYLSVHVWFIATENTILIAFDIKISIQFIF